MAKGWESKGVEEQLAARAATPPQRGAPDAATQRAQGDRMRQRQALELQRELILNQRTSNAGRRAALAAALAQVEGQLAAFTEPTSSG